MTDQTLHCREAFEKWYSKPLIIRDDAGQYDGHTFTAWNAWQAAWNTRAQASASEGAEAVADGWQARRLDRNDAEWFYATKELHDHIQATGHYFGPESPRMESRALYTRINAKAGEVDKDLYVQACEAVEEWKERALKAEKELERAVSGLEGSSTFMGEPAICKHQWIMKTSKGGCIDECTVCGKIRWHKPIVHAHDCNLNMADVAQRMKGCDCGAISTHDKTKA